MAIEWISFGLLLFVSLLLVWRARKKWLFGLAIVGTVVTIWAARSVHVTRMNRATSEASFARTLPKPGVGEGYVASDKCRACHPGEYASWHRTFHRTMTQWATEESVLGDFSGKELQLDGEVYKLTKEHGQYWVEMPDPIVKQRQASGLATNTAVALEPIPRVKKRIGMLTGSHHMQVCWLPTGLGNMQLILPFAWLKEDQRWAPFHQTFLRDPAIPLNAQVWNVNCLNCHTTAGVPRSDPITKQLSSTVAEQGISCEACHGPAEDHVKKHQIPFRRYFPSAKADLSIINPAKLDAAASSQVCANCHGIKWIADQKDWNEHGFRYRPGQDLDKFSPIVRPIKYKEQPWLVAALKKNPKYLDEHYWNDGIVRVSGREYNGMVESPCHQRGQLSCLSCHSMHKSEPDDQLAKEMETDRACLQCHTQFEKDMEKHTRHAASSAGSRCYNCHMPHTTYGLLKGIRSHFIDSPNVKTNLSTGRPNACNLCHLDQTLDWTSEKLTEWYGLPRVNVSPEQKTIATGVLWTMTGDAGLRALTAWAMGWEPARQASDASWFAAYLAYLLKDPYSAVRYIAGKSLKKSSSFADFPYDFVGTGPAHAEDTERALERWQPPLLQQTTGKRVLISDGILRREEIEALLKRRDDRSMDLQE